jgi:hypothetical protein
MKIFRKIIISIACIAAAAPAAFCQTPENLVWQTQSVNAAGSMPLGGGDIGMNVWVEGDELLFYVCRTGSYDENNALLKQGRFRIRTSPSIFDGDTDFRQELHLNDGYMTISGKGGRITLWVDVFHPVVRAEVSATSPVTLNVNYENWRYADRPIRKVEGQQCSYKWVMPKGLCTKADTVVADTRRLTFFHHNTDSTVFDVAVRQQGLQAVKDSLYNPLKGLISGGCMLSDGLIFKDETTGTYADTDFRTYNYTSQKAARSHSFRIILNNGNRGRAEWESGLARTDKQLNAAKDRKASRAWWNSFWQRSFIEAGGEAKTLARNYTLFRFMLGCNAYGSDPSKFNGSLFTFDPSFVDAKMPFTPDFRRWGGGTMTAQNQRLVYWPMLKSGDFDMMPSQFNFYMRMLGNAELRTRTYWGHEGACFSEQTENYGLPNPAEYGFKRPAQFDMGLEYNAWLEYEWDTVLEFCQMILETKNYADADITEYMPLIRSALRFFDEHYRMLASQRGRKSLDGNGKLIIYPGSGCETYKMAYNPASTIAALRRVLQTSGVDSLMLSRIPEIPLRTVEGREMIAPAVTWERVNNIETPQLYPVFPWRFYGVGREGLETARNTYLYDADAVKFHSHIGWKQDNIWAACLGLTDEAFRLAKLKLADGPHRYPAFWGPGYDWTPDCNWGGSGMIGLQEMLLQEADGKIILFPAWPADQDVHFRLHASGNTTVEATLKSGKVVDMKVTPAEREKDIYCAL